jgi:hypothetical protein
MTRQDMINAIMEDYIPSADPAYDEAYGDLIDEATTSYLEERFWDDYEHELAAMKDEAVKNYLRDEFPTNFADEIAELANDFRIHEQERLDAMTDEELAAEVQ